MSTIFYTLQISTLCFHTNPNLNIRFPNVLALSLYIFVALKQKCSWRAMSKETDQQPDSIVLLPCSPFPPQASQPAITFMGWSALQAPCEADLQSWFISTIKYLQCLQKDFALLLLPEKSHSVHSRVMVTDQAKQLKAVEISKAPQCISAPCKPRSFIQKLMKPEGLPLRSTLLTVKSFWLIYWSISVIAVKANIKLQF